MIPEWYNKYKALIDNSISNYLDNYFMDENNIGLDEFKEAVIYSCKGGKRIRSILALEFYLIFSGKNIDDLDLNSNIIKYCIALELLHSYSLVHDDLPCMDNDTFRRGELTTWKKYSDTTATLVGDMLNSIAYEIVGTINNKKLTQYFSNSTGFKGMLGGQVLDIYYEKNPGKLTFEYLNLIHNKKTGALIDSSIVGGIYLAEEIFDNREDTLKTKLDNFLNDYDNFGYELGLAFQIKDDLLDVEGSFIETGKSVGGDEKKGYVYFLGLEKAKSELNKVIDSLFKKSELLNSEKIDFIIKYIATRKK